MQIREFDVVTRPVCHKVTLKLVILTKIQRSLVMILWKGEIYLEPLLLLVKCFYYCHFLVKSKVINVAHETRVTYPKRKLEILTGKYKGSR